jgi:hypothetical protein
LSDQIADHVAMCRKIREEVFDKLEADQEDENADTEQKSRKTRSHMTR